MIIKSFKLNMKKLTTIALFISFLIVTLIFLSHILITFIQNISIIKLNNLYNDDIYLDTNSSSDLSISTSSNSNEYITWVDFNVTSSALSDTAKLDIDSHNNDEEVIYNWIELLAYLACHNGGNFENYTISDLTILTDKLKNGDTIESLTKDLEYYSYYLESYTAVLSEFIGNYSLLDNVDNSTGTSSFTNYYGVKAFLPIANGYSFTHYNDFGNSRSYGFSRTHLGNDLMGSIGTPIVAVESGIVKYIGWNQYGGWRIGIMSFDNTRYYYYAHLRKDHPYVLSLEEGDIVKAGDVIGYLGMTGYSLTENVNNINIPHLHFGMELIFDESQFDSADEIWINVYEIVEFLKCNKSSVYMIDEENLDYGRTIDFMEDSVLE